MKRDAAHRAGERRARRGRTAHLAGDPAPASKPATPVDLDAALSTLEDMKIGTLRQSWTAWLRGTPPACQSGDVLRRLLAWNIQAVRHGGLSREAKRRLKELGATNGKAANGVAAPPITLKPGTMITREWRGTLHRVYVLDRGFAHEGRQYRSLSQVARAIAGTRWSGPRFFGIEAKKIRPASDAETAEDPSWL